MLLLQKVNVALSMCCENNIILCQLAESCCMKMKLSKTLTMVVYCPMSNVLRIVATLLFLLLAICRPSGCTVVSGIVIVGVVVGVCNRSQMRTSKVLLHQAQLTVQSVD